MRPRTEMALVVGVAALTMLAVGVGEVLDPPYPERVAGAAAPPPEPTLVEAIIAEPYVEPMPEPTAEPELVEPYVEPESVDPGPVVLTPTSYTTQDQAAIDSGALVTWLDGAGGLPCLLGGHDYAGWHWIDDIPVGTHVLVTQGACAGEWVVVENRWGPTSPDVHDWMWSYGGHLALQTCEAGGYGYSIARRL